MPIKVVYTAEAFESTPTNNMHLVLGLSGQSCGVAVHTAEEKLQFLGQYDFLHPLKDNESVFFDFVRSQDVLKNTYKTTTVVVGGYKGTLIPSELYSDLHLDGYLRHLYTVKDDEVIKVTEAIGGQAQLVYAAQDYIYYPVRSKYFDARIEPVSAAFIRKSIKHHPNKLNAFFYDGKLCLIHSQNATPAFFNIFDYDTVDEAAYFILNYYQTFNIPQQQLPLLLHGQIHPQLAEILNTYGGKFEQATLLNKNIDVPNNFDYGYLIDFTH